MKFLPKTLTDRDLADIVRRAVSEPLQIDDAETYTAFLTGLAQLLTDYFGGEVLASTFDSALKQWQVSIGYTEEAEGGILCDYDRECRWSEEKELEPEEPSNLVQDVVASIHCPHCGTDVSQVEESEFGMFCPKGCGDFWRSEAIPGDELNQYRHSSSHNMMLKL